MKLHLVVLRSSSGTTPQHDSNYMNVGMLSHFISFQRLKEVPEVKQLTVDRGYSLSGLCEIVSDFVGQSFKLKC